jgi:transposase
MMTKPPPVAKTLDEANEIIAGLWARVAKLETRVGELEAQDGQNSRNSSRPPSSDPLWSKPKRKKPEVSSKSKAGGQPSHPARVRGLVPPDQVDATRNENPARSCLRTHQAAC